MGRTQDFNKDKKVKTLLNPSYTNTAVDTGSELGLEEELISAHVVYDNSRLVNYL